MENQDPHDRIRYSRVFGDHLKAHSTTEIEDVIAAPISKPTGFAYECRISKIDFERGKVSKQACVELNLTRNTRKDGDSSNPEGERQGQGDE